MSGERARPPKLTPLLYRLFRVADALGAPLSAARRGDGPPTDPRPELRGHAYDVAHALRVWRVRRRTLPPGALDAVAADIAARGADPSLDLVAAAGAEVPGGWIAGNHLRVFRSNAEDFARRLELVAGAQRSVWCAFWCIKADDSGEQFRRALAARVRAGVRVGVVLDANIVERFAWIHRGYRAFLDGLRADGVDLHLLTHPRVSQNTHRKLFAVDGRHAIVGGRNIGDDYATDGPTCFLDADVEVAGPAAAAVQALVMDLAGSTDPRPTPGPADGDGRVAVIDQPAHGAPVDDPLIRCLVHAARHARERIDLAFGYMILLPALRRALVEAHRRGVAVRILTNSAASVDYPLWAGASVASLDELVQAGVPVYRMRSRCLHSKCAVFDGRLSTVGSHNLWTLSTLQDAETNLLLDSPEAARQLTRLIEDRLAEAVRVDPAASPVPDDRATRLANRVLWAMER